MEAYIYDAVRTVRGKGNNKGALLGITPTELVKQTMVHLKDKHNIIGDIRGCGLFIGIELIKNYENMLPAAHEAELVVNQMKQKGVLISLDGPDYNVLKIKPPLVFNKNNADYLLESLEAVMVDNNFRV